MKYYRPFTTLVRILLAFSLVLITNTLTIIVALKGQPIDPNLFLYTTFPFSMLANTAALWTPIEIAGMFDRRMRANWCKKNEKHKNHARFCARFAK